MNCNRVEDFNSPRQCAYLETSESALSTFKLMHLFVLTALVTCVGCGKPVESTSSTSESWAPIAATQTDEPSAPHDNKMVTADEMRKLLGANDQAQFERKGKLFVAAMLANSGATTLEPLKGHPLKMLDISRTTISDLSPLIGMPLEKLNMFETPIEDLSPIIGLPVDTIDASHTKVADLSPLANMPKLTSLYLEGALVEDLSPLKDMNLRVLWINECPVSDLTPLMGKQFEEINLCDTKIEDLSAVKTMQLPGTLWLRNTPIKDLSPLSSHALVSLDIQGTKVTDLSSLSNMTTLQRLNISNSEVTDLTALKGLPLTRLIFTPGKITAGIDEIRAMTSLQELDTSFEGNERAMPAAEFWQRYDQGDFKAE